MQIKTIEILQSCMNLRDSDLIDHITTTNLGSNAVIVNQSVEPESKAYISWKENRILFINSLTRGLSISRNIALKNSTADICLICDDDESLYDNYAEKIIKAFTENPSYDVIAFSLDCGLKQFPKKNKKINFMGVLKISSVQIAFRRKSIIDNNIFFDEKMGAGTGNGAGEENKFLIDCLKSNLKIIYIPIKIAKIDSKSPSSWFKGYDETYFLNKGWAIRRILGPSVSLLYIFYFSIFKYRLYKKDCSFLKSLKYQIKGFFQKK